MSLSLDVLRDILEREEEERIILERQQKNWDSVVAPCKEAIQTIWQAHGVETPIQGVWKRPIPSDLYCLPLSAPQSTLVPWSSLPLIVRSILPPPAAEDSIVEVPLSYLATKQEAGMPTTTTTQGGVARRPLSGNLSNKLTEYTRGVTGQCKPFHAGGVDDNEAKPVEDFQTPEHVKRSEQVLSKGSKDSWRDGSLITAPPGVFGFDAGLTWKSVYGDDDEGDVPKGQLYQDKPKFNIDPGAFSKSQESADFRTSNMPELFGQPMFDDDSLFGASSSSENDDGDEDDNSETEVTKLQVSVVGKDAAAKEISPGQETTTIETVSADADEVDALLTELSPTANRSAASRKLPKQTADPLQLAEKQAQEQLNSTRKSWAETKLLPIDDFNSYVPNPALKFPFTLDGFQQQAIARLERSESVFVAAHTSAGKTVVAEYACALAMQRGTRCVYTSPIKALSNQKFRDFSRKFGSENVGLITGDMQLNVDDSTCLIMTTEILRSMLYRGADLIRDIEWVIFDEVHYVNDTERGVVWEEVIIMLPPYVSLIFLSATTPNTLDFSDWIGRTKRKPVYVIKTNYRPVPLCHMLWAGLKLHKVMEGRSGFLEKGYKDASESLLPASAKDAAKKKGSGPSGRTPAPARNATGSKQLAWQAQGSKQDWMSLVRFLEREGLLPTVVFSFSKKKCEEIANMLRSLDLNTAAEGSAVQGFALQTVARLSPSDSTLPQVVTICEMVKRGIGVHHGGLLPILKEMVEILFSRNLIKVLFATETFAMGVNMPARAVVFNSIRKHDGSQFRVLEPGEYTQMAGRAGRRGLDKVGTVILCCFGETPPPLPTLRNMLTGSSTLLQSQFRLTYNMILNLLRVEDMSVESMIKRSFSEFATQRALTANEFPKLLARGVRTLEKLDEQFARDAEHRVGAEDIVEYFSVCAKLLKVNKELLSHIFRSVGGTGEGSLQPGRIILVTAARNHGVVRAPALVLRPPALQGSSSGRSINTSSTTAAKAAVCLVLLPQSYVAATEALNVSGDQQPGTINYVGYAKQRHYSILEIELDEILLVSNIKHKIDLKAFLKESVGSQFDSTSNMFGNQKPVSRKDLFDNPFAGMKAQKGRGTDFARESSAGLNDDKNVEQGIESLVDAERKESDSGLKVFDLRDCVRHGSDVVDFRRQCGYMETLVEQMRSYASHRHSSLEKYYTLIERKETLRERVSTLRHLLSNESLSLFPDFLQRKGVLRTLGYIDENETVCVKGRVACEVNTCEELIVTEMVLEGVLNDLEPAAIAAALSSLVYQEKSSDEDFDAELPESLRLCCERMKEIANNLGQMQKEHGLNVDPLEYQEGSLKFGLVHVVYEWALGVPFSAICELTMVPEGSIVRCITRLDELCREVRNTARIVGNPTLYRKMEAASVAIKRDIVFASSLYVS